MVMQNPKVTESTLLETIEREMTKEELAQRQIDIVEYERKESTKKAEAQSKAQAKAALLERLGITQDEANLLLS